MIHTKNVLALIRRMRREAFEQGRMARSKEVWEFIRTNAGRPVEGTITVEQDGKLTEKEAFVRVLYIFESSLENIRLGESIQDPRF